jgi:hypothetical protein
MSCHAMHPIQDLFLESFSYALQIDMHFICTPMWTKFYSYKSGCYTQHIRVLTNQPLHDIFHNWDSSDRIGKRATELSEYIIDFERQSAIKLQILADFVAEWKGPQVQIDTVQESPWLVYCDSAWGSTEPGTAAILTSPSSIKLRYAARLQFTIVTDKCTNNIIEYETILLGLRKL